MYVYYIQDLRFNTQRCPINVNQLPCTPGTHTISFQLSTAHAQKHNTLTIDNTINLITSFVCVHHFFDLFIGWWEFQDANFVQRSCTIPSTNGKQRCTDPGQCVAVQQGRFVAGKRGLKPFHCGINVSNAFQRKQKQTHICGDKTNQPLGKIS